MRKISTIVLVLVLSTALVLAGCGNSQKEKSPAAPDESAANSGKSESLPEDTSSEESKSLVADESSTSKEDTSEDASKKEVNANTKKEEATNLPNPVATIEMKSGEKIVLELYPEYAPNTVNNFVTLAQSGFYNGLIFHRIIPTFMIQGGDPDGTGMGGPGYSINGEFINNKFAQNVLSHTRGVISMARSPEMNSAGSQFFIMLDDKTGAHLDKDYAGFGIVTEGMEVVDAIASVPTNSQDLPNEPVVIESITIDTKGVENWPAPEKTVG